MATVDECFIFDIDGVLTDSWDIREPMEKDKAHLDIPIISTIKIMNSLHAHYTVFLLTSRDVSWKNITQRYLSDNGANYDRMFMREEGDFTPHAEYKRIQYMKYINPEYKCLGVFEDNPEIIKMFRELGIIVYDIGTWRDIPGA